MSQNAFNPNARYDCGPSAAGCGKQSSQATLQGATTTGLDTSGVVGDSNVRAGFNCAGNQRKNTGGNVAGAPRSVNNT